MWSSRAHIVSERIDREQIYPKQYNKSCPFVNTNDKRKKTKKKLIDCLGDKGVRMWEGRGTSAHS